MINKAIKLTAVLALIITSGCNATIPSVKAVRPSQQELKGIESISVISFPEIRSYSFQNFSYPGFTPIGGLVVMGVTASREGQLARALEKERFSFSESLSRAIENQLIQRGYRVQIERERWTVEDGKPSLDIAGLKVVSDAVLVVRPTIVGFISTKTTKYEPTITTVVTLYRNGKSEPLYLGYHATGFKPEADGWVYSPASVEFTDFESLIGDPSTGKRGLELAISNIAGTISTALAY